MHLTSFLLGLLFLCLGVAFALGQVHIHLTAWQNMTEAEKSSIKIVPLCHNIGRMISASGAIFLCSGLNTAFRQNYFVGAMVLWLLCACVDVWYIGKNNRYQY